jgi:ABC-type amino acid transport substrate-binding protein
MIRLPLMTAILLLSGCGPIPQDPEDTLDRIRAERTFRVGMIASQAAPAGFDRQRLLLRRMARATGASPSVEHGAAEPLLMKLEEGELDLVLGELAPASPWGKRVTILPPLGEQVSRDGHVHVVAIARNGENAWISLLYREGRTVAAQP